MKYQILYTEDGQEYDQICLNLSEALHESKKLKKLGCKKIKIKQYGTRSEDKRSDKSE
jgi:hypothetical protein